MKPRLLNSCFTTLGYTGGIVGVVGCVVLLVTIFFHRSPHLGFEGGIIPGPLPPKTFHESAENFNRFAVETYLLAVQGQPEENAIFSPLGLSYSLEVLLTAARGGTATAIRDVLHLPVSPDNEPKNKPLFEYAPPPPPKTWHERLFRYPPFFISAQSLWLSDKLTADPGFLLRNKRDYFLELFSVDFVKDTAAIGDRMNDWANEKTQGLVPAAAPPLRGDEQVVLLGTLYFKALWEQMFESHYVRPGKFTLTSGETVETPMMNDDIFSFPHTEDEDCLVLEMPYKRSTYSMVFLLPRTPQGIYELERKLDADKLANLLATMTVGETDVTIPKFRIEQEHDLTALFPATTDLSGLLGVSTGPLIPTKAVQKVVLGIDEYGTEAASTFSMGYLALGDVKFEFKARHPFLFLVRDRTSGTIFFIGKLMNPEKAKPREFTVQSFEEILKSK